MTTISAQCIAKSQHADAPQHVLSTLLCRYPRWIHAEVMTHRMFSRNASSSRAVPVAKLIEDILRDPAAPMFWGKNQKGMQAGEEHRATIGLNKEEPSGSRHSATLSREEAWLSAMNDAVSWAKLFATAGYHKQIVNRLLEPFSHITVVISATEWSNFLALRDHPDAEPHIQLLAQRIREAIDGTEARILQPGRWHLPFVSDEEQKGIFDEATVGGSAGPRQYEEALDLARKLSAARCASTSYKTVDGFDMTLERAVALHDKLVSEVPLHASPMEHQAQADRCAHHDMSGHLPQFHWENPSQHRNFRGFRQYRAMLPGERQ